MGGSVHRESRFVRGFSTMFLMVVGGVGLVVVLFNLLAGAVPPADPSFPSNRAVESLLLGVSAGGVLYTGYWLRTSDLSPAEVWHVGRYGAVGAVIAELGTGFVVASVPLVLPDLQAAFFLFVSTGTEGTLLGVVFGMVTVTDSLFGRERDLERRNDDLTEAASLIAHDLKNPLNAASMRLQLAREECESEHHAAIERSHDRMEELIDELGTLAGLTEKREERRLDLPAAVDTCWQSVNVGEATLVVETDRVVTANEGQLHRLLENLLRNAIVHGGEGVTVTVGDLPDGFYVADDGPGITPDERDRVFECGYSTAQEGTGFGLYIVRQIAEAHGWAVDVTESAEGGARFEFTGVDPGG